MKLSSLLSLCAIAPVLAHQKPLHAPAEDEQYQVFRSLSSPTHSIRIKEQNETLCDARSRQYTGWLDVGHKHLFFWYFESQQSEEHDPLTLWQTGGPGGSDMVALFMENGPCLANKDGNSTRHNPYGWSRNSSMLFVDQPAGVGFSYVDKHTHVPSTSAQAATDLRQFLEIFVSQVFPHKRTSPFHISGESYSGHYTPYLAAEIIRHNAWTASEPPSSSVVIPLSSILMGNPALSFSAIIFGYWETMCTTNPGVLKPVLNETTCDKIAAALPECMHLFKICDENPDYIICSTAASFCFDKIANHYDGDEKRNRFDITKPCEIPNICYKEANYIEEYLNKAWVREALDVPKGAPKWIWDSEEVSEAFARTTDGETTVNALVAEILAAGVDVLIYQGKLDAACNTAGNRYWSQLLKWPGQAAFNAIELQPWFVKDDEVDLEEKSTKAGEYKEVKVRTKVQHGHHKHRTDLTRFAFLTHIGAGHLVPYDKPKESLAMLNAWIFGKEFS